MVDIHSHIIPGIDDGSPDIDESIEMAMMAADSGVKYLVATPHCNIPGLFDNYLNDRLVESFLGLKRVVSEANVPLQILSGMEVFATPELPELFKKKKILTLNGTRYFLVEFAFDEDPGFCDWILNKCRDLGYTPIIAHPERYYSVQDYPEIVFEWRTQGYGIQVNKGSILGRFGRAAKKTVDKLLQHRLVSCVASDAHSSYQRTPHMREIKEYLLDEYGKEYTKLLLKENPKRILTGKSLAGQFPVSFGKYEDFSEIGDSSL